MVSTEVVWNPGWHVLDGQCALVLAQAELRGQIPRRTSDVNDATGIAARLAQGLIHRRVVPPAPIPERRDHTRTRQPLVREIAQHSAPRRESPDISF
jgi:hypothetical protein